MVHLSGAVQFTSLLSERFRGLSSVVLNLELNNWELKIVNSLTHWVDWVDSLIDPVVALDSFVALDLFVALASIVAPASLVALDLYS